MFDGGKHLSQIACISGGNKMYYTCKLSPTQLCYPLVDAGAGMLMVGPAKVINAVTIHHVRGEGMPKVIYTLLDGRVIADENLVYTCRLDAIAEMKRLNDKRVRELQNVQQ